MKKKLAAIAILLCWPGVAGAEKLTVGVTVNR